MTQTVIKPLMSALYLLGMFSYSLHAAAAGPEGNFLQKSSFLVDEILPDSLLKNFDCASQAQDGAYRRYYADGSLYQEVHCQNGKLEGQLRQYYLDGTLAVSAGYHEDLLEGTVEKYDKDGRLRETQQYQAGLQDGIAQAFDGEGNLRKQEHYVHGQRDGWQVMYHANKSVLSEETYREGKPLGDITQYDQDGNPVPLTEEYGRFSKKDDAAGEYLPEEEQPAPLMSPGFETRRRREQFKESSEF